LNEHAASIAAISPVRDEAENLPRLARCLLTQTVRPVKWLIVDNGSGDGTPALARALAAKHRWIEPISIPGEADPVRGRPIVRALHAGIEALGSLPDVLISIDADVSFEPDYLERLLAAFNSDDALGIASGSGYELGPDGWRQRHLTGSTVWGATRAYRRACLLDVLPFEERLGWDGIDEFKANARGWRTGTLVDLPFHHHRPEGGRDGAWRMRWDQGRTAHYVGYRLPYLVLRAMHNARRHPSAVALVCGYLTAAASRAERMDDEAARTYVRRQQRLRSLPLRAREAAGRR
jgi:glycosyltransferase involved in cell wall biosynthesis